MKASDARRECKRIIIASVGQGGFEAFLKARQPALEDKIGAQLLETDPVALLKRLKALEKESEDLP